MNRHAAAGKLRVLRTRLSRPGTARSVLKTAGFNVGATMAAALSGIIIARATGPTVRGEYTAVTSWAGIAMMFGQFGQGITLCFYVAHDPERARAYVATSRTMMLVTGTVTLLAGMLLAPVLARGNPGLATAYRIAFATLLISCVSGSYTSALMGRALDLWNKVRLSQPFIALAAVIALVALRLLTLDTALEVLLGSLLFQLCCAYWSCRRVGLTEGRSTPALVRPLAAYGFAQIAASAPAAVNTYLDQLVLSVAVPPADLGRYAIAVSMTLVPGPLVSAIGYVLLPKLAAEGSFTEQSWRLQRTAVLVSAGLAAAILLPLDLVAPWLVPRVFGPAYEGAVPLLWILTPGGIFLTCGQVVANLLSGRHRQLAAAKAQGVAVVFTLALLGALVPMMGVTGAAIASSIPYAVSLALMLRCLRALPDETNRGVFMNVKELVRPLPGVRRVSLLRQRLAYTDSQHFWERNYAQGETSGNGSYGALAEGKSQFLNKLVCDYGVGSVIEFGCGDGNQLSLADYPSYIGLDVSRTAIELCQRRFAADDSKSFFLYDGSCFTDRAGVFTADLAMSLDVVYHLTEDAVFEAYLRHLFAAGQRLVVIYSTNMEVTGTAPHVRHRHFTSWVEANLPAWILKAVSKGPNTETHRADFFVYERP
jgi:O-antigen/teichoic acid export membrane protein